MKRVLLCAPFTKGDLFQHRWVTPALGVWRIASFLRKHGHSCDVYDCNAPDARPFAEVVADGWDVIGFSVLTATLEYDLSRIHEARKLAAKATIVAGGSGAALDYQRVLDNAPVDLVMTAEGEYPMLALCEGERPDKIPGVVFKTKARVLTSEQYWEITRPLDVEAMAADRYWAKTASLYDDPDYTEINTFRLFTQNYCPMNCAFCTLTGWRKIACGQKVPVVGLAPHETIQMIQRVVDAYPQVRQVFLVDDDFFLRREPTVIFLRAVYEAKASGKLPQNLKFICLTNLNRCDEEIVGLAARAGFRVLSIGVESTHQGKLDSMNKRQTVRQIWEVTDRILDHGIRPYYTVILFTPYETMDSLKTDLDGFRKLSEMGAGLSLEPYLIPLPGTPLAEARVPESNRWLQIEGTGKRIRKGFAWLPLDPAVREVFDEYEDFFPKYKQWRFERDGVGHKEKNYQAGVILDCLEIVLDGKVMKHAAYQMKKADVDIVGDFTAREIEEFPH